MTTIRTQNAISLAEMTTRNRLAAPAAHCALFDTEVPALYLSPKSVSTLGCSSPAASTSWQAEQS
ncbi:MAG: hypothetical protein WBX10_11165, partial [Candidatus Sulfotelmatobacter sp.]